MMQEQTSLPATDVEIVARAGRYYRMTRFIIAGMFLVFGYLCIKDGFWVYPELNAQARAENKKEPHPGLDIPLNRALGILLPPLALATLAWTFYNSRGEYRLSGETLHVPGHPAIELASIRRIDKRLWERKGIAYIEYERDGSSGPARFKLDDFVYERRSTDEIFQRIQAYLGVLPEDADTPAAPQA